MNLILLGAPGAGKGTQGALLAGRIGAHKLATGDLLREAVRAGSELGRRAKSYMDAGELVPDALILDLVRDTLAQGDSDPKAIFDGFPRTVPQAESLNAMLRELGTPLDGVVVIDVPEEKIVQRMSGRRTCSDCGRIYNLHTDPPAQRDVCDVCGGKLTQRVDDHEETVRHRLSVYREATEPLIAFYENSSIPVHRVDGDRPVEQVQSKILGRLGR
jgi:adenylate kinase